MLKRIKQALTGERAVEDPNCQCEEEARQSDRNAVEQTISSQETRLRELINRVDQNLSVDLQLPATPHRR